MPNIIKKVIIAFLLAGASSLIVWVTPGDYNHDLAALINKRDLLRSTKTPRIVFIGGSNLTTLDSRHIELELHKTGKAEYSVVNLGLWGGLSIARYLDEIKHYLGPGDIIVLCQEYATLLDTNYFRYIQQNNEANKFLFLMTPYTLFRSDFNNQIFFETIKHVVLLNQLKIKTYLQIIIDVNFRHRITGGFYRYRKDYNAYGDRRFPFKIIRPLSNSGFQFQKPHIDNLLYLRKFNMYAHANNIKVFFSFPPFPHNDYRLNKNQIDSFVHVIRDDLKLTLLAMPEKTVYPESCFADTVNHLQPRCEKIRTATLIEQLRKEI